MKNSNYGHIVNDNIVFADNVIYCQNSMITNPSTEQYRTLCNPSEKLLHNMSQPLEPAGDNKHWESDGFIETDTDITKKWKSIDNPVYPRRWSQLSIETTIGLAGKDITKFHDTLKSLELFNGYSLFRAYDIADYIEEFYPNQETWNNVLNKISESLGQTREELDAFIDTIPTGV